MVRSPAETNAAARNWIAAGTGGYVHSTTANGQRRLVMVSGGMACTLRQFLKLTPKDVIELQLLCYFPRNIEGGASAGHFGPSLATTECPLGSGSKN